MQNDKTTDVSIVPDETTNNTFASEKVPDTVKEVSTSCSCIECTICDCASIHHSDQEESGSIEDICCQSHEVAQGTISVDAAVHQQVNAKDCKHTIRTSGCEVDSDTKLPEKRGKTTCSILEDTPGHRLRQTSPDTQFPRPKAVVRVEHL